MSKQFGSIHYSMIYLWDDELIIYNFLAIREIINVINDHNNIIQKVNIDITSSSVAQVYIGSEILFLQTDCNLFMVGPVLRLWWWWGWYIIPWSLFFTRVELNNILKLDNCQFYYYVTIVIFFYVGITPQVYTNNMFSSEMTIYTRNSKNRNIVIV